MYLSWRGYSELFVSNILLPFRLRAISAFRSGAQVQKLLEGCQ